MSRGYTLRVKLASWNVNGLRSVLGKTLPDWIKAAKADVLCFQETKAQESDVPDMAWAKGYHPFWCSAEKKGYSGTLILSREKPLNVSSQSGVESPNDFAPPLSYEPGKFAGLVLENLYDKESLYGGGFHTKYHVLFYDHGNWRFEYTGYDTAESYDQLNTTLGADEDDLRVYYRVIGGRTGGP
jgi:exodeoxyribonuclease III